MRGVPARWLSHLHGFRRTWREGDGLAVVLAGAAAGYGGNRRRPVTGPPCAAAAALRHASEGRGENCHPATASPPVNSSRLRRVTLAALPLDCSPPVLAVHGLGAVRPGAPKVRP